MKARVSILIVAFNQIDYIDEAIESAVNQDYPDLEIVVSDDGSQDGTPDLIASWQSRFPDRVVALLNRDNVGVTANCNRGLRRCSGHYITWMGGDDVLLPGKVAAQADWLERDQDRVLCAHPILHMRADGSHVATVTVPQVRQGAGPEAFIRGAGILPLQSIMVRADAVPDHGFDERVRIASDLLFCIEVLSRGGTFGCLDEPYYKYRHRPDSVSTRYAEMALDLERTFMIAGDRYPEYRQMCRDAIIEHVMYYGGVRQLKWGNKQAAREQFLRAIRAKPTFAKAWMRLLQTGMSFSAFGSGSVRQRRYSSVEEIMSSELKVSIGMPVHNGEAFIRHALDSLLCQTFAGFELIISDNASTDRTEEICREYASRDCRVRYIRQSSNLGATGNFQFVLDQAVGEYFMWAAADDLRSPASIQVMVDALERNKKAIVAVTDYATFTSHDQLSAVPDSNYSAFCGKVSNDIWQSLGTKMHCMHTYGLFRSSTLRLHRLRNVDYAPDYPLVTFVMFAGDIVYAPGGLMYYFDPVPKRTPEQRVLTDSNRTRIRPFRHIRVALHMASSAGDGFRVRRRRSNFIWVFAASYVLLSKTQWYQSMPVPLQQLWKVLKRLFKRTDNLSAAGTATGRKP